MKLQTPLAWRDIATDIRLWLGLFFLVRLIGITNPPLEPVHAGRQCDVLMIARNFYEIDSNIFFPRANIDGDTYLVGVEFPILNYAIYIVSLVFGFDHWYGRLIDLIVSTLAMLCFYKTALRFFGREAAFNATFIFLFSAWFAGGRAILPDIFGASLCVIALYAAFRYFDGGRLADFLIFLSMACLGCLSKISAASLLTVLLMPMLDKEITTNRKAMVAIGGGITLGVVCLWYFYWVPHLNSLGIPGHFFMGKPISEGIKDIGEAPLSFARRIFENPLKFVGGALVLFSLAYTVRRRKTIAVLAFLIPFLAYFVFILKSGKAFTINGYYFLMLVPMLALLAGIGLSLVQNRYIQIVILMAIATENAANQVHIFENGPPYNTYVNLEPIFDSIGSSKDDLIAIGNKDNSTMALYMTNRKGWNFANAYLADAGNVEALKNKGCKYILLLRKIYVDNLQLPYAVVFNTEDFTIYKL